MDLIQAQGVLACDDSKVVVLIDEGIAWYYYNLIPKYFCASPQMYDAHITVVRTRKEYRTKIDVSGRVVRFEYEPTVRYREPYFYVAVYSDEIGRLRQSLGLTYFRTGFNEFHISVGNTKKGVSLASGATPDTKWASTYSSYVEALAWL